MGEIKGHGVKKYSESESKFCWCHLTFSVEKTQKCSREEGLEKEERMTLKKEEGTL